MGGTSTDVSLIDSSGPRTTSEARIAENADLCAHARHSHGGSGWWLASPGLTAAGFCTLDLHQPGGSWADLLWPRRAAYGYRRESSASDVSILKWRWRNGAAGRGTNTPLHGKNSWPDSSIEQFVAGIVQLAEAEMEKAIRLISVERGYDPREFTLVSFGGAGPLHACSVAGLWNSASAGSGNARRAVGIGDF